MQKCNRFLALLLFTSLHLAVYSQTTTSSPYSRYGIGVIRPGGFSQNFALGGAAIGIRSNMNINTTNPASYSSFFVTSFDVGVTNNSIWLKDDAQSQYVNNAYVDHLAFGVPIMSNKWGMSFGLMPFSNIGYDYSELVTDPIVGEVNYLFTGSGGITKAYWGNGFNFNIKSGVDPLSLLLKPFSKSKKDTLPSDKYIVVDSTSSISFGVNAAYLFGGMNREERIMFNDLPNSFNFWTSENVTVGDFGFDLGMQYQKKFTTNVKKEKYAITVGLIYNLQTDLNASKTELDRTFTGTVDFGSIKDTILFVDEAKEVVQLPSSYGIGFSIEKEQKWVLGIDFKTANWSAIQSASQAFSLKSNYSIGTGFEITPDYKAKNFLKRISYRFGGRYATSYFTINNQQLNEYGITFGVSLPKGSGTAISRLNLSMEYGSRGAVDNGLIKEDFINFNLGLVINDRWFRKRKYD